MSAIPYGRQDITDADVAAVEEVLRSDFLTQGPAVPRFEETIRAQTGAARAVAVNSATSALHLAYLALGLGPGDVVWTSPITFVATSNAAYYCGAEAAFIDVDPRSYNLDPTALEARLRAAREARERLPKIVTPVHFAGQSCDMVAIRRLADEFGFKVVEDASHAIGATYRGAAVGACVHSDIAVFSFHPVKIVTSGEGGVATTNDGRLADTMELLRSHGIVRNHNDQASEGAWHYDQRALGFNYRLTDICAALGASQLQRIDGYIAGRHAVRARYDAAFDGSLVTIPWQDPAGRSALHLYPVRVPADRRRRVFDTLRANEILANLHYIPVYRQPWYRERGFEQDLCPQAERYYAEAISLPMFPTLNEQDQRRVIEVTLAALDAGA